jgi:hypothetical protein
MLLVRACGEVATETIAIAPAATSANPAVTMIWDEVTAAESPAARANGTVKPSAIPITTSRTDAEPVKCLSTCGVAGKTCLPGADGSETYDRGCRTASFTPPAFGP